MNKKENESKPETQYLGPETLYIKPKLYPPTTVLQEIREYFKEHPWNSLIFVLGLLLSFMGSLLASTLIGGPPGYTITVVLFFIGVFIGVMFPPFDKIREFK